MLSLTNCRRQTLSCLWVTTETPTCHGLSKDCSSNGLACPCCLLQAVILVPHQDINRKVHRGLLLSWARPPFDGIIFKSIKQSLLKSSQLIDRQLLFSQCFLSSHRLFHSKITSPSVRVNLSASLSSCSCSKSLILCYECLWPSMISCSSAKTSSFSKASILSTPCLGQIRRSSVAEFSSRSLCDIVVVWDSTHYGLRFRGLHMLCIPWKVEGHHNISAKPILIHEAAARRRPLRSSTLLATRVAFHHSLAARGKAPSSYGGRISSELLMVSKLTVEFGIIADPCASL